MRLLFILILVNLNLFSQDFYLDAITFKNKDINYDGRCDIYLSIPYTLLKFENENDKFYSSYNVKIEIFDKENNIVNSFSEKYGIVVEDYYTAQGGNGEFKFLQKKFNLNKGTYKVECSIQDNNSNYIYKRNTSINILEYEEFPFSLSGLMILSSIEEKNGKYNITPFLSSNLSKIKDGFFVFFEVYTNYSEVKEVDVNYELVKENTDISIKGKSKSISLNSEINQNYVYINIKESLIGKYLFKITLSDKIDSAKDESKKNYLAISQKTIDFTPSLYAKVLENIDLSIKQMKYVANTDFYTKIEESNENEKVDIFIDFWEKLDPTPNTEKNEAFLEYFSRIDYANKNFKSYSDGWLTDKGQVFIIFGQPANISTTNNNYASRETYEVWQYQNNLEFVFLDRSGLGDFRLVRPFSISQRYQFNR